MVQPGLLVHSVGHLKEKDEVMRAQVELALGPAEIKAALGNQQTFRVLARMAATLTVSGRDRDDERGRRSRRPPDEGLTFLELVGTARGRRLLDRSDQLGQRCPRLGADRERQVDMFEDGRRYLLGVDSDQ